jgi:hypothetical protein
VKAFGLALPFAMGSMFLGVSAQADLLDEIEESCVVYLDGDFDGLDTCTVVEVQNESFSYAVRNAGVSGLAWTIQGTVTTTTATTYEAIIETSDVGVVYILNSDQITRVDNNGEQTDEGRNACINHAMGGLATGVLPAFESPNSNIAKNCRFGDLDTLYTLGTSGAGDVFVGWDQVGEPDIDVVFDVAGCYNPAGRNMGADHRQCKDFILQ